MSPSQAQYIIFLFIIYLVSKPQPTQFQSFIGSKYEENATEPNLPVDINSSAQVQICTITSGWRSF